MQDGGDTKAEAAVRPGYGNYNVLYRLERPNDDIGRNISLLGLNPERKEKDKDK